MPHIGNVAHIAHVIAAVSLAQQPVEEIEDDIGARVADMRAVIDGRPTDIETDPRRVERLEGFLAAG